MIDLLNQVTEKAYLSDTKFLRQYKQTLHSLLFCYACLPLFKIIFTAYHDYSRKEDKSSVSTLPLEILSECFSYLSLTEKLETIRVCKSWRDKIQGSDPYDTISLYGPWELEKACEFFESHPSYASQVKKLFIEETKISEPKYLGLPSLFPHVQVFSMKEDHNFNYNPIPCWAWDTKEGRKTIC